MFGRTKTDELKHNAIAGKELALALSRDTKFRKQLASAIGSGVRARRRAARRFGTTAAVTRLANDKQLRKELQRMTNNLQDAWGRVERKRSHKLRNTLIVIGMGGAVAGLYGWRRRSTATGIATIDESIEVEVPVSTAYNQWTQFEEFPLFMEGVDHVEQRGDTQLHWVATVAGHTAEWDAKIVEQRADKHITWISEDGKQTRGTVWFKKLGDTRTLLGLSMSYEAEGPLEQAGSAAGLDSRRVHGDLERFKQLIESRGDESGAWRGDVSAGRTQG
jgi:Polyketide cyclase / dehydrase and lipid transport